MKKLLSAVLIAICALYSCPVAAEDGDTIRIIYSGESAEIIIPQTVDQNYLMAFADGAHVLVYSNTLTEEYVYLLSGSTTNGSLTILGSYKLTLGLAGVSITNPTGAAIDIECGKRIAVVLNEGTTNTFVDGANGEQKAAMYFTGHPEFEGSGILNVTGNTKHAIAAKEYLQFKKTTGTVNILSAVGDGIHCGKGKENNDNCFFQINGGIINIDNVGGDCIDSDDYGVMYIKGGIINGNVTAADGDGLKCDSILYMTGGELNLNVTGTEATGIKAYYEARLMGGTINIHVSGDGAKGIKGKQSSTSLTVLNGGYITLGGTTCNFYLNSNDIKDGEGVITTNTRAISADNNIVRTAGDITIYAYGDIESAYNTDATETNGGGTVTIYRAPWNFYYADYQNDMTSFLQLKVDNVTVTDLTDYAIGAFIGDECVGVAIDDYLRIYSNDLSGAVTFKVYDYANQRQYLPTASKNVAFSVNGITGTPSDPVILSFASWKLGDVNKDGQVTAADATALSSIILGRDSSNYDLDAANTDGISGVTIADLTALVNIILNQ